MAIAQGERLVHTTLIEKLKLEIARLKRMQFGRGSEKSDDRIAQLELIVEILEMSQAQIAETARIEPKAQPVRRPLPKHPLARGALDRGDQAGVRLCQAPLSRACAERQPRVRDGGAGRYFSRSIHGAGSSRTSIQYTMIFSLHLLARRVDLGCADHP